MRNGKKALLMLAGSLLAAAVITLWPVKAEVEVETAVITQGELIQSVMLQGTVRYAQETPYVSMRDGVLHRVYVQPGEPIRKGELLFKLNTDAEEQALAELYTLHFSQQNAISQVQSVAAMISVQNAVEYQQRETQLLAAIEAASIRAEADGIMSAVYAAEGSLVAAAMPLGTAHGEGFQLIAAAPVGMAYPVSETAAIAYRGTERIPLVLSRRSINDSAMESLVFEAAEHKEMDGFRIGESVTIEMITSVQPVCALVPLAAMDSQGKVWVVRDGKACQSAMETGECSRTHASAEIYWAGETVILHPEQYDLKDGIPVKVKK